MGDQPPTNAADEQVNKYKQDAGNQSWDAAYTDAQAATQLPGGVEKLNNALTQSGTLPDLEIYWAEKGNKIKEYDKDNDGALSEDEIKKGIKGRTTSELDRLMLRHMLPQPGQKFTELSDAAGDPGSVSVADLKAIKERQQVRREADDLKRAFPDDKAFNDMDFANDSRGKLTQKEVNDLKTDFDKKIPGTAAFNALPAEDQAKAKTAFDQSSQADKDKLLARQKALTYLSNPDNFKKVAGEGNDGITYDHIKDFVARANGQPAQIVNAAEAVQRTMNAKTGNNRTIFDELAKSEPINGKTNEQRISKDTLKAKIDNLTKPEDKALKDVLTYMHTNFDAIANASADGGTGISQKDLEAFKQLQSPALAQDLKDMFGDKLKPENGVSIADINTQLETERKALASAGSNEAVIRQRHIALLENLNNQQAFNNISFAGQPLPPVPAPVDGQPPAPPVPLAGDAPQLKIDNQDLDALKARQAEKLTLPKEAQTPSAGDKPNTTNPEVRRAVNEKFKNTTVTNLNGENDLKIENGLAVGNYGNFEIGYEFANGKLVGVYENPNSTDKPMSIYQSQQDNSGKATWFARPNGINKTDGQVPLTGALSVDQKGTATRMIIGDTPQPGSAYDVTSMGHDAAGNRVINQFSVETDGSCFGYQTKAKNNSAEPDPEPHKIVYKPTEGAKWESLERVAGTKKFKGDITCEGNVKVNGYEMENPSFERKTGTFSYDAFGQRHSHLADGQRRDGANVGRTNELGVVNWNNGNRVLYKDKSGNIDLSAPVTYEQTADGHLVQKQVFEPILLPDGQPKTNDAKTPMWKATLYDATGKPVRQGEVAFKPSIEQNGKLVDRGRATTPPLPQLPAGSKPDDFEVIFDWDINGFVVSRKSNLGK